MKACLGQWKKRAGSAAEGVSFYRVEELERRTKNDAGLHPGYPSATQFSSRPILTSVILSERRHGGRKNFYCANGATPLLSAMSSICYVLADNDMEAGPLRHPAASAQNVWLYENAYVLPSWFLLCRRTSSLRGIMRSLGDIGSQNELARLLGASGAYAKTPVSSFSNPESPVFWQRRTAITMRLMTVRPSSS